jgi:hypothetical protein
MIRMFDTAKLSPGAQRALDTIATAVASYLNQPTIK